VPRSVPLHLPTIMPAPAVYIVTAVGVVAAAIAFKEFVYEPHIAPRFEAWAESFIENRRRKRRQRQTPVPAQAYQDNENGDENRARRASEPTLLGDQANHSDNSLVELEMFEGRSNDIERPQSELTLRRSARIMDDADVYIPFSPISPMHPRSSVPSSPTLPSLGSSMAGSPPPTTKSLMHDHSGAVNNLLVDRRSPSQSKPRSPVLPPRPPPPQSSFSRPNPLSHSVAPNAVPSYPSSRASTPDAPGMYNTAPMGLIHEPADRQRLQGMTSVAGSRVVSPFSDFHSVGARSPTLTHRSGMSSPVMNFSESESDFDLASDDEFDVLSPRSGMFSPPSPGGREHLTFDVGSIDGSEVWGNAQRRTPGA